MTKRNSNSSIRFFIKAQILLFSMLLRVINLSVFLGDVLIRITLKPIFSGYKIIFLVNNLITKFYLSFTTFFFKKFITKFKIYLLNFFSSLKQIPHVFFLSLKFLISKFRDLVAFIRSKHFKYFVYGALSTILLFFILQLYFFTVSLPSPRSIGKVNFAQSTHIYDRNGKMLYEIFRDVNRTTVNLEKLPKYVSQSVIAIEDKNFYSHNGVSLFGGIFRAIKDTYLYKDLQGGSTITQQLVKTALLSPERTVERKIKEIIISLWAETMYSKDEILEMYLNQVPYGGSAYGVEEAAKIYFGKTADLLTLSESALLAGLPRAPSIYSPFINPELSLKRRNQVLDAMLDQNIISIEEYNKAINEKVNIRPPTVNLRAPHFVMYVRQLLEDEFGVTKVQEGGFNVQTTLDLDIQKFAERVLSEELKKLEPLNASNGSVIIMDTKTGEIVSMIGSVDYYKEGWGAYNVATALRQPGSSLKPMLYALALERGFTGATLIDDSPIVFQIPGSQPYRPQNYDRRFHGKIPLRYALGNSYNIPAVKVLNTLGIQSYVDFASNMGIDTWNDPSRFGLSLSLGGGEVTLLDLAQVFAVFANGGYRIEPNPFYQIKDNKGDIIRELRTDKVKVLDEGIAFIISDILADNNARMQAFGPSSPLYISGKKVSAKTGTTNDYKDAWTVGFSEKYVVAVWVGNNNNKPMHRIAGSLGAGPIFKRIMTYLIDEKNGGSAAAVLPKNVVGIPCYNGRVEYFIAGTESKTFCQNTFLRSQSPTPSQ